MEGSTRTLLWGETNHPRVVGGTDPCVTSQSHAIIYNSLAVPTAQFPTIPPGFPRKSPRCSPTITSQFPCTSIAVPLQILSLHASTPSHHKHAWVRACVRVCMRACVRSCVPVCVCMRVCFVVVACEGLRVCVFVGVAAYPQPTVGPKLFRVGTQLF